jgi:hypothetical protein
MNDTHASGIDNENPGDGTKPDDAVDALAALDPADAPRAAEQYAADLAAELEAAGGQAADPVQLQADLVAPEDPAAVTNE